MKPKTPTPIQLKILRSKAKRKIIRAGRRGGKTITAALIALEEFGCGKRVLYAAPTTEQTDRFWTEVSNALAERIDQDVYRKNESERTIKVPFAETRIKCKTAWNADTLRGDYADVLILDEFQLMNEDAWNFVGAPMLLDTDGDAVFIYTPLSIATRGLSKAKDKKHAAKFFERAKQDGTGRFEVFSFTSHENPYISEVALAAITQDMTGLAYRQEILAQDITEIPGALWTQALLDKTRIQRDALPELVRIVIGVDPSGSSTTEAGIVAAGIDKDGQAYVLADRSLKAPTPEAWGRAAITLYHELRTDRILGERNYGGDMIAALIRLLDVNVAYADVTATRGKLVRADPISARFAQGRAHLVGDEFSELEGELTSYVPGNSSPNRLDAMVRALTELQPGAEVWGVFDFFKGGFSHAAKLLAAPRELAKEFRVVWSEAEAQRKREETVGCAHSQNLVHETSLGYFHCNQCGADWADGTAPQVTVYSRDRAGNPELRRK